MKIYLLNMVLCFVFITGCDNGTGPETEPLKLSATSINVSVEGASDGSIDLTVQGGERPYLYEWSNGSTTEDISNLTAGIYSVTVRDSKNRTETFTIEIVINTETGTVTDIDGNIYKTVQIGNQIWMAENLRVKHDPEGNAITSYVYNNDTNNEEIYGRLYTWSSVMNGATAEKSQGIAPRGWHIPSDSDWQELFDFLGGASVAGGKMKATGTEYWKSPNSNATNSSGFTSLPAGGGRPLDFEGLGEGTHFWSSSSNGKNATAPTVHSGADVLILQIPKTNSISVRCVKNK